MDTPSAQVLQPRPVIGRAFVHRIQDETGRGPFQPGFSLLWFQGRDESEEKEFAPFDVRVVGPLARSLPSSMRYAAHGCRSQAQLRRWFLPQEYHMLRDLGFRAVTIEADAILMESPLQVFFARALPLQHAATPFDLYPH